uniref:RCD1 WWE domain-containing protein n=1 Tax=Picea sitchensis TaxID=3332 RepID=B8LQZ4_PICSI|nr:unknown [Picea sitchensis]
MRQSPSIHARQSRPAKRAKSAQPFSCCSGMVVVENYNNFRKSGIPARFMYLCKGEWIDFPSETVCILKQGFQSGKTAIEIAMRGSSSYLVDFLRMSRIDLSDGFHTWIAWIDIQGKCFFPRVCCQENPSLDIKVDLRKPLQTGECEAIATNNNGKPTVVESESESALEQGSSDSVPGEDHSQLSDDAQFPECRTAAASVRISESGASTSASPELESGSLFGSNNSNNLMIKLEDSDREFVAVRDRFLGGLSTLAALTSVVGIYRTVSGQARSQTFQRHAEDVARKSADGNANVRYAWHGTSNKGVSGIILHGFGHPKRLSMAQLMALVSILHLKIAPI